MVTNILGEIKNSYEFLTKTERKIADIILSDPNNFTKLTIVKLSSATNVSQGSINNFSKKFCGGGFSDLKLKIAGCISSYRESPFSTIDKTSSMKAVLKHRIDGTYEAFNNTAQINPETALKEAAEKILCAKRVELYGVYQSGIVARDLCYQLINLGIPASYQEDTLMGAVTASMLDSSCLAIALSSSGETKDIIDAVTLAKNNGCKVICFTSNKFSPLAKISDNVLLSVGSGWSISDKYNEQRLSQMLLADTICSYLRSVIDESGNRHYYKTQEILSSHSVTND